MDDKKAWVRYRELITDAPISGNFDRSHLEKLHQYIFQDYPFVRPGEIRPDTTSDYVKNRTLDNKGLNYPVYYATKDLENRLDTILAEAGGVDGFKDLNNEEFSVKMTKLYGDLDHIHPFLEGNSRTLRLFTGQLAQACGKNLDWTLTSNASIDRENLYLARDFEVAARQFPGLTGEKAYSRDSTNSELDIYRYFLGQIKNDLPLEKIIKNCTYDIKVENDNQKIYGEKFSEVWADLVHSDLHKTDVPKGYVLGGQPGAGKGMLIEHIKNELQNNVIVINGDDFRRYHPDFDKLHAKYGQEASKYTAEFSAQMTKKVIEKAINEGYNVAIEWTFKNPETPIKTLAYLHKNGYEPHIAIMTCPKDVSWSGTREHSVEMNTADSPSRYLGKAHHDFIVDNIGKNADAILATGLAKTFKVYNQGGLIFDKNKTNDRPSVAINKELDKSDPQKRVDKTPTKNNGLEL